MQSQENFPTKKGRKLSISNAEQLTYEFSIIQQKSFWKFCVSTYLVFSFLNFLYQVEKKKENF